MYIINVKLVNSFTKIDHAQSFSTHWFQRKKQLCELRLKVSSNVSGSEEQSPSNFLSYDYEDEQDEGLGGDGIEGEEDGKLLKLFYDK